jgi:hypothetical protein
MSDWDRFVEQHPLGLLFHASLWQKTLEDAFAHIKGHTIVLRERETGKIRAGIPIYSVNSWLLGRRLISIPFASLNGLLLDSCSDFTQILPGLMGLLDHSRRPRIELRAVCNPKELGEHSFASTPPSKHHFVQLNRSPDEIYASFSRTAIRRVISKGLKMGVQMKTTTSFNDLRVFYDLFVQTRRRLSLPPIPFVFFESIFTHLAPKHLTLVLAYQNGNPIGAVLGLKFKSHFFLEYSGELDAARNSGVNQLLYWFAMKQAIEEGYKIFSFGRTSPSNLGLIQYKRHWGTVEEDLPTFILSPRVTTRSLARESSVAYRMAAFLAGKAPMPFFHLLGRFCFTHWA